MRSDDPRIDEARRRIDRNVISARESDWSRLTPAERGRRLRNWATGIRVEQSSLADAERFDTGKPSDQARTEILETANVVDWFAGAAEHTPGTPAGVYLPNTYSHVRRRPIGVVAAILPWNYPAMMVGWRAAPALAAGCPVVVKPSPLTPGTAGLLAALAAETLGPGVLTCAEPSDLSGALLAAHPGVAGLAFTGSPETGQAVTAAGYGKHISMELGGNSPAIVLPDAPLTAAGDLHAASTYNAGQSCAAPTRVIVVDNDPFIGELVAQTEASDAADFGPLISQHQHDRATAYLDGHDLIQGIAPKEGIPPYFPATLVFDATTEDPVVQDEVFAPVLTVEHAVSLIDALTLANAVPQRLAASVWTRDLASARTAADHLDVGELWVNCHLTQTPGLPHSGRGPSGWGTDLGLAAMLEWSREQTITEAHT